MQNHAHIIGSMLLSLFNNIFSKSRQNDALTQACCSEEIANKSNNDVTYKKLKVQNTPISSHFQILVNKTKSV